MSGAGDFVFAISGEFGNSVRISCASSRGFFFSGRASCIAALLEKSPCDAFFGRSISRLTGASQGHRFEGGSDQQGDLVFKRMSVGHGYSEHSCTRAPSRAQSKGSMFKR